MHEPDPIHGAVPAAGPANAQEPRQRRLFGRVAGPELASAAACGLMLLPPLAGSDWARGMADVVAAMGILVLFELPLVVGLIALASKNKLPQPAHQLVYPAYGALALSLAFLGWSESGMGLRFVLLLALPMAMRGIAIANHLHGGGSLYPPFLVALFSPLVWVGCLIGIALPLSINFGSASSAPREFEPFALNAMGMACFVIVGLIRWRMALAYPER